MLLLSPSPDHSHWQGGRDQVQIGPVARDGRIYLSRGVEVFAFDKSFVFLFFLIYMLVKRLWFLLFNSFAFNKVSLHCPDTKGDFDTIACCYNTGPISRYKNTDKRTPNIIIKKYLG